MNARRGTILLVLLLLAAAAGVVWTRFLVGTQTQNAPAKSAPATSKLVDERPFVTAQKLAALAVTSDEREFAQDILGLADHELDLAFASALRIATLHPTPPTPAAKAILGHISDLQDQVKPQQDDVAHLKSLLSKATEKQKQALQEQLDLEQTLLEVSQEELDAAQQELIRAGGDPKSKIQQLMDQHEARNQRQGSGALPIPSPDNSRLLEEPESRSAVAQSRAWLSLNAKGKQLSAAQQEVNSRAAELAVEHQGIDQPAAPAADQQPESSDTGQQTTLSILKRAAEQQQDLAELDKRVSDLQQIETLYGSWGALIQERKRGYAIGLVEAALWVLIIVILVFLADPAFRFLFSRLAPQSQRLGTPRTVVRFAVQVIGAVLILLVIFGPPNQLATIVALAGAGLTVALKDFIVGFFGWFALMGRHGIRTGDWVEIEGVGGEVLEVGLLHTVLLETGNWSDAGHPTGRKVSFMNSFAIEGHYFNFSTSGQWLWDEIEIPVPSGADPYPIAEAVQKVIAQETQANARLAEQEWQRVVPSDSGRLFSAAPAVSVRPTSSGMNVTIRYITRAQERHQLRTRLYHQIVEILRMKDLPPVSEPSKT